MEEKQYSQESERRLATVMFADISGFTAMSENMDPEDVTAVMNGVFRELELVIDSHGGHIDKFIGDCVMVLFGVPQAIENAPLQAVNTAIEMRHSLYRFNTENRLSVPLDIHIGMNTGPVVAGQVGGRDRKDFTVMGDTVNLASRIEGVSEKGQILVGPETYRATRDDFEYRPLPPVSLKGKAEPVPVYEVLSARPASAGRRMAPACDDASDRMIFSAMVGRDHEMSTLRAALSDLIMGRGGIVNVIGEAGIGKSRLMVELKAEQDMQQVALLEGQAISMGRNLALHPIIDLLKNWAGIREYDIEGASFAKLEKAVRAVHPDEADEIIPFTATLMGMKLSGRYAERIKGIEGEAMEKLIFRNIRALLIRGSEIRPMIIRIEDLHWADTSSIELLLALFGLAREHRILFLNFFRPNYEETGERVVKELREKYGEGAPLDAMPVGITREAEHRSSHGEAFRDEPVGITGPSTNGLYTEIRIQPLDGNESSTLIANLLNIRGLPQIVKDQIAERAGGNPFFIEEVVRSLIDDGAVVKRGDSFTVTEKINSIRVPLTINEVLMSRIDRLDEETKALIKTASVIGRYFFHKIITQVAHDVPDVDDRLEYLEGIQLIRERKRMDELEFLFKHALAQEAVYESLLIQKRRELHLEVAQAIEEVFGRRLKEFYGMLALHYSLGENLEKAEEYMLKAGEEAMKSAASNEALGYYRQALDVYLVRHGRDTSRAKIADMERNIGMAYSNRGYYVEAVDHLDRALEHFGVNETRNPVLQVLKLAFNLCFIVGRVYFFPGGRKREVDDRVTMIYTMVTARGKGLSVVNPRRMFVSSVGFCRECFGYNLATSYMALGMMSMTPILFVFSGISMAIALGMLGYIERFLPSLNAAVPVYPYVLVRAVYDCYAGTWGDDLHEGAVDGALRCGDSWAASTYLSYKLRQHLGLGSFAQCGKITGMLGTIGNSYNDDYGRSLHHMSILMCALGRGDQRVELLDIEHGIAHVCKVGNSQITVAYLGLVIMVMVLRGALEDAGNLIRKTEEIVSEEKHFGPHFLMTYLNAVLMYYIALMDASLEAADAGHLRSCTIRAVEIVRRIEKKQPKLALYRTGAYCRLGSYHWLAGNFRAALRWWARSVETGRRLGARPELARAYFEIARRLLGKTDSGPCALMQGKGGSIMKRKIGLTPEECLAKADTMFKEMDLQWDLVELAKLREKL